MQGATLSVEYHEERKRDHELAAPFAQLLGRPHQQLRVQSRVLQLEGACICCMRELRVLCAPKLV